MNAELIKQHRASICRWFSIILIDIYIDQNKSICKVVNNFMWTLNSSLPIKNKKEVIKEDMWIPVLNGRIKKYIYIC